MTPNADAGPLYGIVWPILISVAVTPGDSLEVPAPPRRTRPTETASAAIGRVLSQDLLLDMDIDPSFAVTGITVLQMRGRRQCIRATPHCVARLCSGDVAGVNRVKEAIDEVDDLLADAGVLAVRRDLGRCLAHEADQQSRQESRGKIAHDLPGNQRAEDGA